MDETQSDVRPQVARAHPDGGTVGSEHLDDRADVADLAVIAVLFFDRIHLRGDELSDLRLVYGHALLRSSG
jgi:hypothetical protein